MKNDDIWFEEDYEILDADVFINEEYDIIDEIEEWEEGNYIEQESWLDIISR